MKHRKRAAVRFASFALALCMLAGLAGCTGMDAIPVDSSQAISSVPSSTPSSAPSEPPSSQETSTSELESQPSSKEAPASSKAKESSAPASSASPPSSAPAKPKETGTLSSIVEQISSANQAVKEAPSAPASSAPTVPPASSAPVSSEPPAPSEPPPSQTVNTPTDMKAVWLSYLEFQAFRGSSESVFTQKISAIFDTIAAKGLNTVIVQVRPYGDSFYPSDYYPWSKCISGTMDVDPGYDPMQILVDEGHARGLSIHAWINPYRTMTDSEFASVSSGWPIRDWYDSANRASYMIQIDGRWWLQPGNAEVQQLIENGVNEILSKYAVDGIHLDDYFYNANPQQYGDSPEQAKAFTTQLVKALYDITKAHGSSKLFGVSPMGAFRENASLPMSDTGAHSTDLALWCSQPGYLDYVMPQVYWGYDHSTQPYTMTLEKWQNFVTEDSVALYIGLAPYQLSADVIENQIADIASSWRATGYCLFRYDHIHGLTL